MSGLLERFNFNGSTNVNAVMVYSLSERGDQKLTEIGFPAFDLYDRSHNSHQALLDLLDVGIELGVRGTAWRNNNGAFNTERGGFYRVGTPGAPDIIGCVDGKFVGLEVKTAKGKLSDEQEAFAHLLRANGGQYHLVRSIDDVQALSL